MQCLLCANEIEDRLTLQEILRCRPLKIKLVCQKCRDGFYSLKKVKTCVSCGRRCEDQRICADCHRWQHSLYQGNKALYEYNDAMHEYMSQYKFYGDYRLRYVFQEELTTQLAKQRSKIIVPIPVGERTLATRGFNQVVGLIDRPIKVHFLLQTLASKEMQSAKSREERLRSDQPFEFAIEPKLLVNLVLNKEILLVDDVYTTGTTIRHAASLFEKAGVKAISSITLAR